MAALSRILAMLAVPAACLAVPAELAAAARADPSRRPSIEELKAVYLECERAALKGGLDGSRITDCSGAYEELKRRAFGNDYGRLKAWFDLEIAKAPSSRDDVRGSQAGPRSAP